MNSKRYYELTDREIQMIEVSRAKRGAKSERDQAVELYDLLRNYTYQMIGLGNCFRRIAGDFSGSDGSNWRNNRRMSTGRLAGLADSLRSMDPSDVGAILKVERELESIIEDLSTEVA
jgi:hypothetical protein